MTLTFLERKQKRILQSLRSLRKPQNLRLKLSVKRILLMTTLRLKLSMIRRKLIATANHQSLLLMLRMKNLKTILIKFVNVFNISARVTTTSAGLKKKPTGRVKNLSALLKSLWRRIRS